MVKISKSIQQSCSFHSEGLKVDGDTSICSKMNPLLRHLLDDLWHVHPRHLSQHQLEGALLESVAHGAHNDVLDNTARRAAHYSEHLHLHQGVGQPRVGDRRLVNIGNPGLR